MQKSRVQNNRVTVWSWFEIALSCFKMTLTSFWNIMKQLQTNLTFIMTIHFAHDCFEMVRCSSVFRMSSIFAETSVSRTKKKPWGEIEKSCSYYSRSCWWHHKTSNLFQKSLIFPRKSWKAGKWQHGFDPCMYLVRNTVM